MLLCFNFLQDTQLGLEGRALPFVYCTFNAVCHLQTLLAPCHAVCCTTVDFLVVLHRVGPNLYFEAVSSHALFILPYEVGAFLLGIIGGGEEHALVAFCLLLSTDATRLDLVTCQLKVCMSFLENVVPFVVRRCPSSRSRCWRRSVVLEWERQPSTHG
jgi:hypothetical protein